MVKGEERLDQKKKDGGFQRWRDGGGKKLEKKGDDPDDQWKEWRRGITGREEI